MIRLGYTGKVPHRGDFVRYNVPSLLQRVWNDWLAAVLPQLAEHSDDWTTGYDASPVWRFSLSTGIAGDTAHAGVMIATSDSAGRRYPYAMLATVPPGETALEPFAPDAPALEELENLARQAVADAAAFDALPASLSAMMSTFDESVAVAISPNRPPDFRASAMAPGLEPAVLCNDASLLGDRQGTTLMLDAMLRQSTGPYSVWQRRSNVDGDGRLLLTAGMPSARAAPLLFGAEWSSIAGGWMETFERAKATAATQAPAGATTVSETAERIDVEPFDVQPLDVEPLDIDDEPGAAPWDRA